MIVCCIFRGCLSPVLFFLYIDELLLRLTRAGIGYHIGNFYVGTLAYADDVVLITPTASAICVRCSPYVTVLPPNIVFLLMLRSLNV